MAKSVTVQRKVLKLNSEDIRNYTKVQLMKTGDSEATIKNTEWCYEIDTKPKKVVDYVIGLGSSNTLRMLDKIMTRNKDIVEIFRIYGECIKELTSGKEINLEEYKDKNVKWFHDQMYDMQFQENYIIITFQTKLDYKLMNKNGLRVNNKRFKRLYGTSASVKNNTVMYVCDDEVKINGVKTTIHAELLRRLENGHDKSVPMKPAKYESYLSLNSSASTPTSYDFNEDEILVVHDHVTKFKTNATLIHECIGDEANIENIDDGSYEFEYEQSDGACVVDISVAEIWSKDLGLDYTSSGFVIRNAFLKGASFPMDIRGFLKEYKSTVGKVVDVWGKEFKDPSSIKLVLPTSVLKLWKNYSSISDYLDNCKKNGHVFAITKSVSEELENERTLNYQFVQSLEMSDEDAYEFMKPTIDEFHDILKDDYRKTILYLKGKDVNEADVENFYPDFTKAMMIDERVLSDPHIRQSIKKMLSKAIDDAKIAKIKCAGNYQLISPDMVAFLSHAFNFKKPIKALSEGEFYSEYWLSKRVYEVLLMRAPMCTYANYRKVGLVKNKMCKWFEHMKNVFVFNAFDTTAESLSGAD